MNAKCGQPLHRKIWAIADDVRGAVDGWDFKQYILGILFYRFISENITDFFNSAEHEAGDLEFDYAEISDEEAERDFRPNTVEDKGFFILGEIIREALDIHRLHQAKGAREERINELLERVGLNSEHSNRYPHEFSGGQQQRIGMASLTRHEGSARPRRRRLLLNR